MNVAYEFDAPEKMEQEGNFLAEPGTYHFAVLNVEENPTNKKGSPLDGFRVHVCALDGTAQDQQKKELELMFFSPKMSDKNNGEFSKRKIARFAVATGILPSVQPGQRVTIDLQQAVARQFVAEVEPQTDQNTGQPTKFLQLAWANIWHVDDPAVSAVPKDAAALELLPKELRKTAKDFEKQEAAGQNPAAGASPVNLDDL